MPSGFVFEPKSCSVCCGFILHLEIAESKQMPPRAWSWLTTTSKYSCLCLLRLCMHTRAPTQSTGLERSQESLASPNLVGAWVQKLTFCVSSAGAQRSHRDAKCSTSSYIRGRLVRAAASGRRVSWRLLTSGRCSLPGPHSLGHGFPAVVVVV